MALYACTEVIFSAAFLALFDPSCEWIQSRDLQGAPQVNLGDDLLGKGRRHCFGVYSRSAVYGVPRTLREGALLPRTPTVW